VFAREIGIGVSTLQWWLRRARERARPKHRETSAAAKSGPLLEVELADAPGLGGRAQPRYEIELGDDVRLRLPGGFRAEEVRRLLALLREARD
jgi:transposase-like protein